MSKFYDFEAEDVMCNMHKMEEYQEQGFGILDFPCNQFACQYFNGGGHKNASGGEFFGSLEDAVATFEKGLKEFNPNKTEEIEKLA